MKDKEIKVLAREYIEYRYRNYHAENRDRVIEQNTNELYHIFKWISERCCIVSKEKVKKWSEESELTILDSIDLIEIFTDLFGEETFTDKNEKQ